MTCAAYRFEHGLRDAERHIGHHAGGTVPEEGLDNHALVAHPQVVVVVQHAVTERLGYKLVSHVVLGVEGGVVIVSMVRLSSLCDSRYESTDIGFKTALVKPCRHIPVNNITYSRI